MYMCTCICVHCTLAGHVHINDVSTCICVLELGQRLENNI